MRDVEAVAVEDRLFFARDNVDVESADLDQQGGRVVHALALSSVKWF
jgi:hypothetical protein